MAAHVPPEMLALQRLASVAQVGGFRPPSTPRSSWVGAVLLATPGEAWPAPDGRPMFGVCQILIDELVTAVPAPLDGVALLTLFIDLEDLPYERPHGHGWELRTYPTTDGLVPLTEPEHPSEDWRPRPFPLLWRPRTEIPALDELPWELHDAWNALYEADPESDLIALDGIKVGGWASTIQCEVDWSARDAEFVFQVDSDDKAHLHIGDSGTVYIGWSASAGWQLSWQCF